VSWDIVPLWARLRSSPIRAYRGRYEFTFCAPAPAQFARAARAERSWLAMISAMMPIENQSP
jgi:hypothetical protein